MFWASSTFWTSMPTCFSSPLDIWSYLNVPWMLHIPHVESRMHLLVLSSVCPVLWVILPLSPLAGNPKLTHLFLLSHPNSCLSPALWWYLLNVSQISPLFLITTPHTLTWCPFYPGLGYCNSSRTSLLICHRDQVLSSLVSLTISRTQVSSSFNSCRTLTKLPRSQIQCPYLSNRDHYHTFLMRFSKD